jgi:hypothetical protein
MEELLTLKQLLQEGNIKDALIIVDELEEMSKSDKLNKIFSYGIILMLHLIKQVAENRSTRSWETSIFNAVKQIQRINQRRKSKGNYLDNQELLETFEDGYELALREASLEAFGGIYDAKKLENMVNKQAIIARVMALILEEKSLDELSNWWYNE